MAGDLHRLLTDASAGDPVAVESLLERYLPDLRAFFRMQMGPRILARENPSDLAQSVCREVLEDLSCFDDRGEADAFRRWLFLTAYRKVKDKHRFYGRERRDAARERQGGETRDYTDYVDLLSPSRIAIGREELVSFEVAFDALTDEQRQVVTCSKLVGMSHAEIAAELGKTEGAVRVVLHRALARLGRLIDDAGGA